MMRSRWSKWLSGVGGVVLIGGLVLANYGAGVTPAEAHHGYQNPFKQILSKLNLILEKLNSGGGGAPSPSTGGAAGNYTMRWDTNKPSAERFTVLTDFGSAAVRDNNTGLVWEQSPVAIPPFLPMSTWNDARLQCVNKTVGGQKGWRLPSIPELASLVDPSVLSGLRLPSGHPFSNVTSAIYWSATSNAGTSNNTWSADFGEGQVVVSSKTGSNYVWCVRGPMSESVY